MEQNFLEIENDLMKSYKHQNIAIIKFKKNVFDFIIDQKIGEELISIMENMDKLPDIRAILFLNEQGSLDDTKYDEILEGLTISQKNKQIESYKIKNLRVVAINLLHRIIIQFMTFNKLTICGLQGRIATPFFGACLALDFRYAPENMNYSLTHIKRNHYPSGALPFFLSQHLGRARTIDILLSRTVIPAEEALEMKLINKILPSDSFEKHCIDEIKKLCEVSMNTIISTKQLINYSSIDIEEYFEFEKLIKG